MKFDPDTSYRVLTPTGRSRLDSARWRRTLGRCNLGSCSSKFYNSKLLSALLEKDNSDFTSENGFKSDIFYYSPHT